MNDPRLQQSLQLAQQQHRVGQLAQAEVHYRQVLHIQPNQPDALHGLGLLAHQSGQYDTAVRLISEAIRIHPVNPHYHSDLALSHQVLHRFDLAIACHRRAITLNPELAELHSRLGQVLGTQGRLDNAIDAYNRALAIKSDSAEIYLNLGNALSKQHEFEEAVACYQQALASRANYVKAHYNLGLARVNQGKLNEAVASFQHALTIQPAYAEAHCNLGNVLRMQGHLDTAVHCYQQAIVIQPGLAEAYHHLADALSLQGKLEEASVAYYEALALNPDLIEAYNNLGNALCELERPHEAVACYQRALAIRPGFAEALNNLGSALGMQDKLNEAMICYEKALAIKPDYADAHWNEGTCRLLLGDLDRGWQEYEWRWHRTGAEAMRFFPKPRWLGWEDLLGKTIFLYAEQGLGDTIQFCRYASYVAARGAKIVLEVYPPLKSLLSNLAGVSKLIVRGDTLPPFDLHCPLLSLPFAFKTTLADIPASVPYLAPEPVRVQAWQARLRLSPGLKVGLAWAGSHTHKHDRQRSLPLAACSPLRNSGATFISLQPDLRPADQATLAAWPNLRHFGPELRDFADTAALISHLDLVISADTSVAHLAGALGKPVWILLPYAPDWRWLLHREDSPWYPTARLLRQPQPGDWDTVIKRAAANLKTLL